MSANKKSKRFTIIFYRTIVFTYQLWSQWLQSMCVRACVCVSGVSVYQVCVCVCGCVGGALSLTSVCLLHSLISSLVLKETHTHAHTHVRACLQEEINQLGPRQDQIWHHVDREWRRDSNIWEYTEERSEVGDGGGKQQELKQVFHLKYTAVLQGNVFLP